jgi:hypothetical protein
MWPWRVGVLLAVLGCNSGSSSSSSSFDLAAEQIEAFAAAATGDDCQKIGDKLASWLAANEDALRKTAQENETRRKAQSDAEQKAWKEKVGPRLLKTRESLSRVDLACKDHQGVQDALHRLWLGNGLGFNLPERPCQRGGKTCRLPSGEGGLCGLVEGDTEALCVPRSKVAAGTATPTPSTADPTPHPQPTPCWLRDPKAEGWLQEKAGEPATREVLEMAVAAARAEGATRRCDDVMSQVKSAAPFQVDPPAWAAIVDAAGRIVGRSGNQTMRGLDLAHDEPGVAASLAEGRAGSGAWTQGHAWISYVAVRDAQGKIVGVLVLGSSASP